MDAITIKNLSRSYKDFDLDDINLSLPRGCIMGLIGENGAGKTTLINLIMNVIRRDKGNVTVLGVDNRSEGFRQIKEEIGIVPDEAYFPETLTARNVHNVMKYTYRNWQEERYFSLLDHFSLPLKKSFRDFSRGMKMKLAIAVALSHDPKLLILDEATSGLDPVVRDEILDIFNDFTRDERHSILISSHIVSDLEKICDYIAFLHQGKLLFCEEKDRLLEKYAVLKLPHGSLEDIPSEALVGVKENGFGAAVLVRRELVSAAFPTEHTTLEDIMLFLVKGV